jgi:hypothetical protein
MFQHIFLVFMRVTRVLQGRLHSPCSYFAIYILVLWHPMGYYWAIKAALAFAPIVAHQQSMGVGSTASAASRCAGDTTKVVREAHTMSLAFHSLLER